MPIERNGQAVGDVTLNGNTVDEVTVNGQTVFSAGPNFPVAYSNLVAWYPFDSATYGGSNTDDVTAILGGSGDDTAYDGTVSGATYQSSGGVTDINAGANSGAFDFDGSNDTIIPPFPNVDFDQPNTIMGWANADTADRGGGNMIVTFGFSGADDPFYFIDMFENSDFRFIVEDNNGSNHILTTGGVTTNTPFHVAGVFDGSNYNLYVDGSLEVSQSKSIGSVSQLNQMGIGVLNRNILTSQFDGAIDDVRVYDTDLSSSQINQIYQNTEP